MINAHALDESLENIDIYLHKLWAISSDKVLNFGLKSFEHCATQINP